MMNLLVPNNYYYHPTETLINLSYKLDSCYNCSTTTIRWPIFKYYVSTCLSEGLQKRVIIEAGLIVKYIGFICSKRLEIYDFMKVVKNPWGGLWSLCIHSSRCLSTIVLQLFHYNEVQNLMSVWIFLFILNY